MEAQQIQMFVNNLKIGFDLRVDESLKCKQPVQEKRAIRKERKKIISE